MNEREQRTARLNGQGMTWWNSLTKGQRRRWVESTRTKLQREPSPRDCYEHYLEQHDPDELQQLKGPADLPPATITLHLDPALSDDEGLPVYRPEMASVVAEQPATPDEQAELQRLTAALAAALAGELRAKGSRIARDRPLIF